MTDLYKNFAYCTITSNVSNVATSIPVDETSRLPTTAEMGTSDFYMTFEGSYATGGFEIVKVTAKSTTSGAGNLTVVRGQEGTTAVAHTAPKVLKAAVTSAMLGRFVDLATAQTLSSKTLSSPTFTGTVSGNVVASGYFHGGGAGPGAAFRVGDDATINDINTSNTIGIQGISNSALGGVQLGTGPVLSNTGANDTQMTGNFYVKNGTKGWVELSYGEDGSPGRTGYIAFFANNAASNNRQGYIGYSTGTGAGDSGTLNYVGGKHSFNSTIEAVGGITFGSGSITGAGVHSDASGNLYYETGASSKIHYFRPNTTSNNGMLHHQDSATFWYDSAGTQRGTFQVDTGGTAYFGVSAANKAMYQLSDGTIVIRSTQEVRIGDANVAGRLGAEVKLSGSGYHHWSILNNLGALRFGTADGGGGLGLARTDYAVLTVNGLQANGNAHDVGSVGTSETTTSTTYTDLATVGPDASVVCGPSGRIAVYFRCSFQSSSTSNGAWAGIQLFNTSTSTEIQAPIDEHSLLSLNTDLSTSSSILFFSGLVEGQTYRVRMKYRHSTGTGTYRNRRVYIWSTL